MEKLPKVNRREVFGKYLQEVIDICDSKGMKLDLSSMPGKKREFMTIGKSRYEELATIGEAAFSEYMSFYECKFKAGVSATQDKNFYGNLFKSR